ncbi:hypothetical protein BGX31_006714 [Mortierella sp. GBA43]|nr:hypothetical protein BGX31_006714 [Mortierella sp. GBA43]
MSDRRDQAPKEDKRSRAQLVSLIDPVKMIGEVESTARPKNNGGEELSNDSQAQRSYWTKALAGASTLLDLPGDRPRISQQPFIADQFSICLDTLLTLSLRKLAVDHHVDLETVLLAGWSAVLARLSGQEDIVIGFLGQHGQDEQLEENTLPLRIDLSGEPNTVELLGRLQNVALSAMAHRGMPLQELMELAGASRQSPSSLSQVGFQWQTKAHPKPVMIHNDVHLHLWEQDHQVVGGLRFSTALFERDTIKRHSGYLTAMLRSMVEDPTRPVATIDIVSPEEKKLVLETWNETSETYPEHLCFHQLFEIKAQETPGATAIVHEDQTLSYEELNARANRLAHHLIELGVQVETRVAICVERSPGMIVGILAIVKAGGTYVPLDPSYASSRVQDIIQDASPTIAIADKVGQSVLGGSALTIVDPNMLLGHPISNPTIPELTARSLAYIIYTSGSTGKPKGVMIEHRGLVSYAMAQSKSCGVHPSSRVLQLASCGFDASVWEFLLPLTCGASLYLPPSIVRQDRKELWDYMTKHSITIAAPAPSFLQDGKDLPERDMSLFLSMGGEALGRVLLRNLISRGCTVVNEYGPTETTISALCWRCTADLRDDTVPIGKPIANTQVYILDKHQQPVPLGVAGEMYIGGVCVARGYLNRPDLTAERFLQNPFVNDPEARMYRTGDLARYLPDGNIVFLGRNDDQVKIRGFRIEPGEIEARLADHSLVQTAAVFPTGEGLEKRLVAYVVARPEDRLVHILRSHLASCLPDYMAPAAIVRLDSLPLTTSGKIDRRALPEPDSSAFARQEYEEPQGEIESSLSQIWTDLLSIECVGRHDNFFELGGHSLLALRMLERLRGLELAVSVRAVYEYPVLKDLAQAIGRCCHESLPPRFVTRQANGLTPGMVSLIDLTQTEIDNIIDQTPGGVSNVQDIYPLLPLQDGILFHHLLTTTGDPYLLGSQMAFENRELLDRYLQAFQKVVDRHDILRAAFIWKDLSTPVQVILRRATIPVQEIALDPADGPIVKQLEDRFHPDHYRVDLTQAPLIQCVIAQDMDGRWVLFQLMHHLIGDHAASETMNLEIERILHGLEHTLPAPQPLHNQVVRAYQGVSHTTHEKFFKEMLGDIVEPTFPFGLSEVDLNGANITESHQIIPQDLNDRLRLQTKQIGVSLASLCHVAWAQVIGRASGQDHVVFGTVLFGGPQESQGGEHAMGLSINTLPFRCDTDVPLRECIRGTHVRLAELLEHEHASLSLAQRCSGVAPGTPLFSAHLNYLHTSLPSSNSHRGTDMEFVSQEEQVHYPGIQLLGGRERTNYPIAMTVQDFGTALGLTVQTLKSIDSSRAAGYMRQALESVVAALEGNNDVIVSHLEVIPPEERTLLIHEHNSAAMDYPQHQTLHGLFEQQVEQTAEAAAVVFMDQSLSYAELNEQANRLAYHLIELGVQPETHVTLCVDRSLAMIIGVLAVLKAGGAYVPLDPAYGSDRLRDTLMDATSSIVIADDVGRKVLGQEILCSMTVVDPNALLVADSNELARTPNPRVLGLTSRNLAYIIYTSGSTGKPKGVMLEHQGAVNLIYGRPEMFGITSSSRALQFTSLSFDHSVSEIFSALTGGACLHLIRDDIRLDRSALWEYISTHSITHVSLTPSILQDTKDLPVLKTPLTIVIMGESLSASTIPQVHKIIPNGRIINEYGPTETSVATTVWDCPRDFQGDVVPIGRPIPNKTIYILDKHRQPVPLGAAGEIYIGGVGVARGYLNRPELTAAVFLPDPFAGGPDARMYKTGDLACYLPDRNVMFLGRNDHQIKIRGFRVELGEIEARLSDSPLVNSATVIALGDGVEKQLVAYVVAKPDDNLVHALRSFLSSCLPDYMVPAAIVRLDSLPLTSNGKLDRKALPAPESSAFARQDYEEPQGEIELALAQIWTELLHIDRVGRNDNFFALGGHSLLVVRLIEQLRRIGLSISVRTLFKTPTLHVLAQSVSRHHSTRVPSNVITEDTATITPTMLPLISLSQVDIDYIVNQVPGGVSTIQDIYALSPLQEGILFHHLLETKGDPYLSISCSVFESRELLDRYLTAVQQVMDRHDILRTAIVSENMTTPAQVVWRRVPLSVSEMQLDAADGPIKDQLMKRLDPRFNRINLNQPPLLRHTVAMDDDGRWVLVELLHHLIGDHSTFDVMEHEVKAFMEGRGHTLPPPQPFRNLIAQVQSGHSQADHEQFFTEMLFDIDTLSLPFGLTNVHGHGGDVISSYRRLPQDLNDQLRRHAKALGVSVASLCHVAWAMVVSRTSGEDRVVFGTVLFGRMHSGPGADSAMGLFINTLPLRVDVQGGVRENVLKTHERLASLLDHEHASLAIAQRCSSVPQGTPLFSSMLNYRYNIVTRDNTSMYPGIEHVEFYEGSNYPLSLSVEDYGTSLGITADVVSSLDPVRVCGYMQQALENLTEAIDRTPDIDAHKLDVIPIEEHRLLTQVWNETQTQREYPEQLCIQHLFEQQVERTPEATAVVSTDRSLSYAELNERANRLAHDLIGLGLRPDAPVAISVGRSLAMVIAVLGILKAGGAYVPLDPAYASDRLKDILADVAPSIVIVDEAGRAALGESLSSMTVLDSNTLFRGLDGNDEYVPVGIED